jgi:general stress protein 26
MKYGKLSRQQAIDKVWELAGSIGECWFITWDGERQRARPLAARPRRGAGAIYFLTDEGGAKDDQIRRFPVVSLAFADSEAKEYLTITGQAEVSDDRARIAELFGPLDRAWWDSADDPSIRLITFRPQDAEIWGGLGRLRAGVALLAAAVSGANPELGDNRKIDDLLDRSRPGATRTPLAAGLSSGE